MVLFSRVDQQIQLVPSFSTIHMDHAVVTGVAGFIGSHLATALLDNDTTVTGVDNYETGDPDRITPIEHHDAFTFVEGDLRDQAVTDRVVEDADVIFHQAAVPSVPRSVDDPVTTTTANCVATANLVHAARNSAVDTLIVASSSSVYGSTTGLPKQESMPVNPESPYALSKYYTEQLAVQAHDLYDLNTAALRYFNVFGPRQNPDGEYAAVIPKFITRMLNDDSPVIYGDGEQSRDFTYIQNVIDANLAAATSEPAGLVANIGCGNQITVNELVTALNDILDTDIAPVYDDPRPGDVKHSYADISTAESAFGYSPAIDFREGLRRTVSYFQQELD